MKSYWPADNRVSNSQSHHAIISRVLLCMGIQIHRLWWSPSTRKIWNDLLNPSGHQHRTDSPLQHDLSEEHAICRICRLNSRLSCAAMNLRQKNTRDRYLEIPPESQNPMLDRSKNLRRTAAKLCAIGRSRADLRESTAQSIGHVDQENRSKRRF